MRLFTAVFPPADVVAELSEALRPVKLRHPDLRWSAESRWHVTLCFHGDDVEPGDQLAALEGLPAPTAQLAGSGTFRNVLWIGVQGELHPLAEAAGAVDWRPHLTVARSAGPAWLPHIDFTGREWTVGEVALVRSHPSEGYVILDRVPLSTPNG
jgi:RNA 2',3'-cyclic 3'-phosphodiesterase